MALRFCDSFDHYATADLLEKWTSLNGAPTIVAAAGRRGTAALRCATVSTRVELTLDSQATWIVGVAFRYQTHSTTTPILQLRDGTTLHVDLRLNGDGTLTVTRNGTALGSTLSSLSQGTTSYLEFKATIADATGAVEVRIDGVTALTLTGVDTRNAANASANRLYLGGAGISGSAEYFYDDLYLCDGQGSVNNDFLGDCRVDALVPNGDGDVLQFTPSSGADHYALVDETPPNDDTDYNESNTVGHRDLLHVQNLAPLTDPAIYGVQVLLNAKKTDAGARGLGLPIKSGATVSAGADQALATSYTYYRRVLEQDPDTSSAWTEAGVNALQIGADVMS